MSPGVTETLANLSIPWITGFVILATLIRIGIIRIESPSARSGAEILESGIIAVVLVWMVIRPFVVQAYFIPSPSMEPTLLGNNGFGDRILVNKLQYRIPNKGPSRQDVVVFIPPAEATDNSLEPQPDGAPINFIKRLIGMPGDRIQAVAGRVVVNGTAYDHNTIRNKFANAGIFGQNAEAEADNALQADHHVKFTNLGVLADGQLVPNSKIAEIITGYPDTPVQVVAGYVIRNGKRLEEPYTAEDPDYDLKIFHGEPLKNDANGPRWSGDQHLSKAEYDQDNSLPTEPIPPGHYFMMGDNRNDSKDSTEWGPLDVRSVVGKAQFIFWPFSRVGRIK
jgi:signal peptidase I